MFPFLLLSVMAATQPTTQPAANSSTVLPQDIVVTPIRPDPFGPDHRAPYVYPENHPGQKPDEATDRSLDRKMQLQMQHQEFGPVAPDVAADKWEEWPAEVEVAAIEWDYHAGRFVIECKMLDLKAIALGHPPRWHTITAAVGQPVTDSGWVVDRVVRCDQRGQGVCLGVLLKNGAGQFTGRMLHGLKLPPPEFDRPAG